MFTIKLKHTKIIKPINYPENTFIHIDKKNFNIFIISSLNEYLRKCYKKPVFSRGMNNAVPIARTTLFIYREQYCSYTMKSTVHAIGKDQIIF